MFRSLHMKLVLIMVLMIFSVMLVVGTLMVSRMTFFYLDEFRGQMEDVFTTQFLSELTQEASGEGAPERMRSMLYAYSSNLGIDDYRQYSILSSDGAYITGSDAGSQTSLEITPNIIRAIGGEIGDRMFSAESYMDLAIPISGKEASYIIYIRDSNDELNEMKWMLVKLVIQVFLFGMIFAIFLSVLLSKTMTTPLENVTKGAVRLASGEFDNMIEVQGDDEIGKLTSTFNDMAQTLKETLADIESERNKLDTLFKHMTDGVAAFDKNSKILHMNPAAESMLGIKFSEDLTYNDVLGNIPESAKTRDDKTGTEIAEYDYGDRIFQVFIAPLSSTDQERGIMAVIHDVTQQQKLERARREFVANVSHELRTPLTSIKSYTETIMASEDLPPDLMKRFLEVINNESDRMARIVKDLLTLSRLDNGKFDLKPSSFASDKLLQGVHDAMFFEAKSRSHTLVLEMDDEMPMLYADRERIEQVVVNILSNSVKYTPNGGKIVLSGHVQENELVIAVQDNGVGIPEEDIPRLFERFYRVEKARSRDRGGTGLGLAIASEIVKYHNGTIEVESKVDVGTKITVRLPLTEQKNEEIV